MTIWQLADQLAQATAPHGMIWEVLSDDAPDPLRSMLLALFIILR